MMCLIFILFFIFIYLLLYDYEYFSNYDGNTLKKNNNFIKEMLQDIIKRKIYGNYMNSEVLDDTYFIYNLNNTYKTPYSTYIIRPNMNVQMKIDRANESNSL